MNQVDRPLDHQRLDVHKLQSLRKYLVCKMSSVSTSDDVCCLGRFDGVNVVPVFGIVPPC